jgi:hypothetical protein
MVPVNRDMQSLWCGSIPHTRVLEICHAILFFYNFATCFSTCYSFQKNLDNGSTTKLG